VIDLRGKFGVGASGRTESLESMVGERG